MKRILAILCAMACLFALAVPAMAAETVTVTAQVPADWEFANVYIWGGPAGEIYGWPGEAMVKGADGRYTYDIPSGSTNIIINKSDGTQGPQTTDLIMDSSANVWIVYDGTNATVHTSDPGVQDLGGGSTTPPTDTPPATLPDGEKVKVHAFVSTENVSPRLWAWQEGPTDVNAFEVWPGEAFTKDGDWWTIEMPASCDSIIVNNGSDKQTADTTVEAGKEIWVVVQYDWTAKVYYKEPDLDKEVKEEPPIDQNPMFSRPTAAPTEAPTQASTEAPVVDEPAIPKKTQAIIVIATGVVAIVAIAFVLSIPKKMK